MKYIFSKVEGASMRTDSDLAQKCYPMLEIQKNPIIK